MYKIIGADQKEYGPVDTEQLRLWINESRVNAQTKILADGTTEWKALAEFPEFAGALGAVARPAPALGPAQGSSAATDTREAALQAVKGPAIALIVTASLGIAYYAFNGVFSLAGGTMFQHELPPNIPPQLRSFIEGMQGPLAGVISLAIAALNAFVLFGAMKLMRLQSQGLVMVACVVAMLPCQCCCVLGLPFGIWALVVLNKPEVKSWFS
jgi:hypothetical protein